MQCAGKTVSGARCMRSIASGAMYCWQHQTSGATTIPVSPMLVNPVPQPLIVPQSLIVPQPLTVVQTDFINFKNDIIRLISRTPYQLGLVSDTINAINIILNRVLSIYKTMNTVDGVKSVSLSLLSGSILQCSQNLEQTWATNQVFNIIQGPVHPNTAQSITAILQCITLEIIARSGEYTIKEGRKRIQVRDLDRAFEQNPELYRMLTEILVFETHPSISKQISVDELASEISILEQTDTPANRNRIRDILGMLRNNIEEDFWRELMFESPGWVIDIAAEVLQGLYPDLIMLIPDLELFKKYLYNSDPNLWITEDMRETIDELEPEKRTIINDWLTIGG